MARNTTQTESIASANQNGGENGDKKPKSRRPANTAFRQQRLKAWQPILTPKTVLPLFFVFGVLFAPLGGLMLYASDQVQELVIDYSDCIKSPTEGGAPISPSGPGNANSVQPADIPSGSVSSNFATTGNAGSSAAQWLQWTAPITYYAGLPIFMQGALPAGAVPHNVTTQMCSLYFDIPNDIGSPSSPVLLYYRLTNFYQNHRRYVKSFDSTQLSGTAQSLSDVTNNGCDPLEGTGSLPYYPCGVVANSIFNDTFNKPLALNTEGSSTSSPIAYNMTNQGIAWSSDAALYGSNPYTNLSSIAVPPYWAARWQGGVYTESNPPPDLKTWQEFQVWMRTAGLPYFSKLALRNDNETMTAGKYLLNIGYNFPVLEYSGTKSIVISTSTVIGGKNPFLGIAYIVVAGLCILLGLGFTAAQLIKPRKLGDHTHLTWNNEQTATATSTGVQRQGANAI